MDAGAITGATNPIGGMIPADVGLEPILAFHRGPDSYVSFHVVGADGEWEDLASIRVSELQEKFPTLAPTLERGGAFSINSFYRASRGQNHRFPGLERARRNTEDLRYLNAAYCDLDGYKLGMTEGEIVGKLFDLQHNGSLPTWSFLAFSGRGVWAFWLLRDMIHQDMPQSAFKPFVKQYAKIQDAISLTTATLMSDAKDAARVMRCHGSINPKYGRRVQYLIPADKSFKGYTWTLDELARFFGIPLGNDKKTVVGELADDESDSGKYVNGFREQQANRLRQFIVLKNLRGGFGQGCRNFAAMLYAHFLHTNGKGQAEIEHDVGLMAGECKPPLSKSETDSAIRSGMKMKVGSHTIKNQTIANMLDISPVESGALETWPAHSRFAPAEDVRDLKRDEIARIRRSLLFQLAGDDPDTRPSLNVLRNRLLEYGYFASRETIRKDLSYHPTPSLN